MSHLTSKIKEHLQHGGVLEVLKMIYERIYVAIVVKPRLRKIKKREALAKLSDREQGDYRANRFSHCIMRTLGKIFFFPLIVKNRHTKILVVLHFYYSKSADEVISYLKNLNCYNFDLVITFPNDFDYTTAKNKFLKFKPNAKIIDYPNQGYDIGPFLEVIRTTDLNQYDIIIKLQTKNTTRNIYIYKQFFRGRDWFKNLYKGVLGDFSVHHTIGKLQKTTPYGVVAAKNLIVHDPKHKQELVKENIEKNKKFKYQNNYYFVAGSCFAIKSACLKPIQKSGISLKEFEKTKRGTFSLAHIMERVIFFYVSPKYTFYGNKVDFWRHIKWTRAEKTLNQMSALSQIYQLGDYEIPIDYAWAHLEHCFLEKAESINLKLKDIRREHPQTHKLIGLEKCEPYLYLQGGKTNEAIYEAYCDFHAADATLPDMTRARFDKLIKSIKQHGYNSKIPILVDAKNVILDGQHRACVLLYLYGAAYEIPVLRLHLLTIDPSKIKPFSKKVPLASSN